MACQRNNVPSGKCIKNIFARSIFDSRGNPTVEVDLITDLGLFRAAVPSGASTGVHEALELRDEIATEYLGKGVSKAVENVNNFIGPELVKQDFDVTQQELIDQFMIDLDGTENKSKFGANAILGISLAVCKAGAAKRGVPLYRHIADLAGNKNLEFMILPTGASSFREAMKMGAETYQYLKKVIKDKFGLDATAVGDEGGFAPNIQNNKDALGLINDAIAKAGYTGRIEIGMDVAASEFYKDGLYDMDFKNPKSDKKKWLKSDKLFQVYQEFIRDFPMVSIEDPFDQDDWEAWSNMSSNVNIQIVGDDLTVTNPKRIEMAVERNACNCLLLKVNQIGTVSESIKAHLLAKSNGWGTMVSHRSGETEDTFIADLVVGLSTGQIKTGAPCRSERLAKYNQILRIEEELCAQARYAGKAFRRPI
ncbi:hypothetical protein NQ315_011685 [Exocentrus adspersus]|uniref:Enolase n=1 Tax=Exocentrus adspersus TaxID=1586481 RepID=A0AAV8W0G0_9CUCU|nr:hypothetical protein NQ315_011685 [Exocentrus adspersus]